MIEDPPRLESAEEKATRIWRNAQIIREPSNIQSVPVTIQITKPSITARQLILQIFNEKRNDILMHYQASIWAQKRRLMLEKIKRLERIHGRE